VAEAPLACCPKVMARRFFFSFHLLLFYRVFHKTCFKATPIIGHEDHYLYIQRFDVLSIFLDHPVKSPLRFLSVGHLDDVRNGNDFRHLLDRDRKRVKKGGEREGKQSKTREE
jgi:hypothetical protein